MKPKKSICGAPVAGFREVTEAGDDNVGEAYAADEEYPPSIASDAAELRARNCGLLKKLDGRSARSCIAYGASWLP